MAVFRGGFEFEEANPSLRFVVFEWWWWCSETDSHGARQTDVGSVCQAGTVELKCGHKRCSVREPNLATLTWASRLELRVVGPISCGYQYLDISRRR